MLPTITQRLMMVAAIVLGTLCWLSVLPLLKAADGSAGLSLMDARSGVVMACVWMLLAGLPALLAGLYVSSAGNPLSGVFTVGISLMILAAHGGSMQGLINRQAERPSGEPTGGAIFLQLEMEMVLWALAWCLMMFLTRRYRWWIRHTLVPRRLKTPFPPTLTEEDTPRFVLQVRPAMAGLLCAMLGWILCRYIMQTHENGQVIGSILLSFVLAGLTARLALPTGNVVFLLLSPLLVGFASYAYATLLHGSASADELILRWQRGEVVGPMFAMPIHWASAGLIGVSVGIGMAQAIDRVRTEEHEARQDSDTPSDTGPRPDPTPEASDSPAGVQ